MRSFRRSIRSTHYGRPFFRVVCGMCARRLGGSAKSGGLKSWPSCDGFLGDEHSRVLFARSAECGAGEIVDPPSSRHSMRVERVKTTLFLRPSSVNKRSANAVDRADRFSSWPYRPMWSSIYPAPDRRVFRRADHGHRTGGA